MITLDELHEICPQTGTGRLAVFIEPVNDAMREFAIDTPVREAAFIAQVAHESGGFVYVQEIASGKAYEGRADLGNTEDGDGVRYKGRGLIQITGKTNYSACGDALGLDLISSPELLEEPVNAARSAAWFWSTHGCNDLADKGDFQHITRKINGGLNGYQSRVAYWNRAQEALA